MLVDILESVGQPVTPELEKLAKCDSKFRNQHQKIGIKSMNMTVDVNKEYSLHASHT